MNRYEAEFATHLRAHGIEYLSEYRFNPERRWRADFFIKPNILVEIEGGIWIYGRHNRADSMIKDMEKYNAATLLGYRVFRFEPGMHVKTGLAIETIVRAISEENVPPMRKNKAD